VEVRDAQGMAQAVLPDGTVLQTAVSTAPLPTTRMTVGMRPETVRVAAPSAGNATGTARVVERLGDRTLVHAALSDGTLLTAEDRGDSPVRAGETVGLALDGAAAHLFAEDGTAHHAVNA